jgi:hypothetical protein
MEQAKIYGNCHAVPAAATLPNNRPRSHILAKVNPRGPRQVWSLDLISVGCSPRNKIRALIVVDAFDNSTIDIELLEQQGVHAVTDYLDKLVRSQLFPQAICVDSSYEAQSRQLLNWAHRQGIGIVIAPTPWGIERAVRQYQREVLAAFSYEEPAVLKAITKRWLEHRSFGRTILNSATLLGQEPNDD